MIGIDMICKIGVIVMLSTNNSNAAQILVPKLLILTPSNKRAVMKIARAVIRIFIRKSI